MRTPTARQKPRTSQMKSYPAPRNGWISNLNLAQPGARNSDGTTLAGAAILDDFFPTATGVRFRRGSEVYATLGGGLTSIASLFSYINGAQEELFAANTTNIYNITASPASVAASKTSGDWVVTQFATAGGIFLRGVNGADVPFVYDGATFSLTPALTIAGPDPTTPQNMSYVWAYKNRLFFIKKDSLDVYYLPVDVIGGALTKLPLGGVFPRGGSLLFGGTWSLDAGEDGGLSEQCVFVTTEGEVAVFQGDNPATAATWSKVGVYRIGQPLGAKAWIKAGGDIVIATDIGLVPLSQAVQRDFAALSPSAVSYPIEVAWNNAVYERSSAPWHCEVWPNQQMAVVALPTGNQQTSEMFVANVRTGAWGRFTGWNGLCLEVFRGRLFFGSSGGKVIEANVGGMDQGLPYSGACVPLFEDLGAPASLKIAELARAVIRSRPSAGVKLTVLTDFNTTLPPPPDASPIANSNEWGTGIWGTAIWGQVTDFETKQDWVSVAGAGSVMAPALQLTSGTAAPVDVELVRFDLTYQVADIVT